MGAAEIVVSVAVSLIVSLAAVFLVGPWIWEEILCPLFSIIKDNIVDKFCWWRDAVEKLKKRRSDEHGKTE